MHNAYNAKAYSAASETSPLASDTIPRRNPTERDVQIEILFCGICHSDLHQVRNEWSEVMPTVYPCVPGHEIVGRVTTVGSAVNKYKSGDLVAVGCMVDSDRTCPDCRAGLEQFCPNMTLTYNWPGQAPRRRHLWRLLRQHRRRRAIRAARSLQPRSCRSRAAPLRRYHDLLADAPLGSHQGQESRRGRSRRAGPHGREVRPCARSARRRLHDLAGKKEDALRLGADEVVVSRNANEMQKHAGSFDFILDAVSADHDINAYINLLRRDGNITLVGAPEKPLPSLPSACFWAVAASPARPSAASPKRRRCSTSAARTTSPPMSKSSQSRRSTKPTRGCSSPM